MIELVRSALIAQYGAGLSMFANAVTPAELWVSSVGTSPFSHIAYHALYFTDLYLSRNEASFTEQPFHLEAAVELRRDPARPEENAPCDKELLLAYIDHCRNKVVETIMSETEATLAGPGGFWHGDMPRLELHLYNIRHLQHHTGQLATALRSHQDTGTRWVGTTAPRP